MEAKHVWHFWGVVALMLFFVSQLAATFKFEFQIEIEFDFKFKFKHVWHFWGVVALILTRWQRIAAGDVSMGPELTLQMLQAEVKERALLAFSI